MPEGVLRAACAVVGISDSATVSASPVGGGCINRCLKLRGPDATFFMKWRPQPAPGFFESEREGLYRLAGAGLSTPRVHGFFEVSGQGEGLVLDWVGASGGASSGRALSRAPSRASSRASARAGRQLAQLHGIRGLPPGAARDGFIGTLEQRNGAVEGERWPDFFHRQRLMPFASMLPDDLRARLERLDFRALVPAPEGGCALLHGDLWGGNLLWDDGGLPWFIDPAVYAGHPEVDLAMTRLFGGFSPAFYDAYEEVAGRFDGALPDRLAVLNLYPLLVHVALFGGSYISDVRRILLRFT